MTLTTSYQKVAETKMGSFGYGTLYLRTYAKYNSQSITDNSTVVAIQARIYNNGTYCYSGNCYSTLQGTKLKDNVLITFTGSSEITLGTVTETYSHNIDGTKSISITDTFKCYAFESTIFSANATVDLPQINRMDKATANDFDIGSSTTINITRYNPEFTRTVVATIGSFSETIMSKGTATSMGWTPDDWSLYEQTPNSNTGTITFTTTTYNGNTVIGTTTSTCKCRVTNSVPVLSAVIITDSLEIVASDTLVRYLSVPTFAIRALAQNCSTLTKYSVTELNSTEISSTNNEITLNSTVKNNSFVIKVTDSRGNSSSTTITSKKFIEYNLPAISKLDLTRTGENLNQIKASISGVWYNQDINNTKNTISLKYRYKTSSGEYSSYNQIAEIPTEAQFTIDTLFNPEDGFDVNSVYTIEVVATDILTSGNLTSIVGKATPLIDHWNENDKDYYNINAEIQQNGVSVINSDIGGELWLYKIASQSLEKNTIVENVFDGTKSDTSNNKLIKSGSGVKIGSGVKFVNVRSQWRQLLDGVTMYIYILKNGEIITANEILSQHTINISELVEVKENDVITIDCYCNETTTIIGNSAPQWDYLKVTILA